MDSEEVSEVQDPDASNAASFFHMEAIEPQTGNVPDKNVPCHSSSGDDDDDDAALAKKQSCKNQSSWSKPQEEAMKKLEELLQPSAKSDRTAGGQADMEVEEEQDRKVAAKSASTSLGGDSVTTCGIWKNR